MFKFFKRAFGYGTMKSVPFEKKVRVLRYCIENILKNYSHHEIPVFQRVNSVMEHICNRRLVGFYFENRRLIPALCAELKCL